MSTYISDEDWTKENFIEALEDEDEMIGRFVEGGWDRIEEIWANDPEYTIGMDDILSEEYDKKSEEEIKKFQEEIISHYLRDITEEFGGY